MWSTLLAHLVLHCEEAELFLMLCVFPEHVVVCRVVDGEAPPLHCVSLLAALIVARSFMERKSV